MSDSPVQKFLALAGAGLVLFLVPAHSQSPPGGLPDAPTFLAHTRTLSSDAFEGRAPGTSGEATTVEFIADQFRKLGLIPSGDRGTYFQAVPLVGITGSLTSLTLTRDAAKVDAPLGEPPRTTERVRSLALQPKEDFVAWTKRAVERTSIDGSELVFVGYGVEAPELAWDDYKGVELAGKTMVVLIGDPPVPDPRDPARLDPKVFGGPAMTYYGRWTYKYDIGAAKKAAGVLIVHEADAAGYGFSIVQGRLAEQFDLRTADNNIGRPAVEGWITLERARQLFALAGLDFDALKRRAATRAFTPVPLGVRASLGIENRIRSVDSRNVVARLEGRDPRLRHEHVVYTAHWDSFGRAAPIDGETIRHGALDNATGVAGLLEVARVLATSTDRPRRSFLFVSVTAEEQGLLGSEYYTRQPIVPLERTLAVLNFEMVNPYGRTSDLTVYGLGASELDDYLRAAAARQHRTLVSDPAPEQGWFYRSDHFPFARRGVPAVWAGGGDRFVGRPADYGKRMRDEYVANRYHKPADVVRPEWDLAGAMEDLQIYVDVGRAIADADRFPEWRPGAEFRAARDAMLKKR